MAIVSIVATDPIAIAGTNCWTWLGLSNAAPTWSNWVSPTAIWTWFTNCGPQDAAFTVHRIGPTNNALVLNYSIGGTASNGVDYVALSGMATIAAGQTDTSIMIVPNNESTNGGAKTVLLGLPPSIDALVTYLIGFPPRAEALIINSESPLLRPANELLGDRSFFLNADGPDGAWFRIDYSTNAINWSPLCTNQVVNGSINFADPDAAQSPMRLYREVPLPNLSSN